MRANRRFIQGLLLAAGLATASPAAAVLITAGNGTGMAGQAVDINISTADVTGLAVRSFQFQVTYNANLLTATDVLEAGTLSGTAGWGDATFNVTSGRIVVSHAGVTDLTGAGALVRIRFVINPAQLTGTNAQLTLSAALFNEGNPVATTANGTLTIQATPVITVSPSTGEIIRTQTLQFTVSGSVTNPVTWGTTNNAVATISGTGLLTGVAPGEVRVFAVDNAGRRDTTDGVIQVRGMGLSVTNTSVVVGQTATVPITVTSVSGLGIRAGQFRLSFNGNFVQPTGVTTPPGTLLNGWGTVVFGPGDGYCIVDFAGGTDLAGAGTLCYVTFNTMGAGNHTITPSLAVFNEILPARVTSGVISVSNLPTITVSPENVTLFAGQTQQFTLSGSPTPPITWSTLDPTIAFINAAGMLTALAGGVTRVRAVDNLGATDLNTSVTVYDFTATVATEQAPPGATVRLPILVDRNVSGLGIRSLQYRLLYNATWITAARAKPQGLVSIWGPGGVVTNQGTGQLVVAEAGSSPIGSGSSELQVLEFDLSPSVPVGTNLTIQLTNFLCNEGRPIPLVVNGQIQVRTSTDVPGPVLSFALGAPVPNPASGPCRIRFAVPRGGEPATLAVHAVDGRRVRTLYSGVASAGEHDVTWDGRDADGGPAATGLYFVHVEWMGQRLSRKLAWVR